MEEKKINKNNRNKILILGCLSLALIFFIIGISDIKSNAAESADDITFYTEYYNDEIVAQKYKYVVSGQDDMEVFYFQSHTESTNTEITSVLAFVVSKSPMTLSKYLIGTGSSNMNQEFYDSTYSSLEYTINGQTFYISSLGEYLTNTGNGSWNGYVALLFDTTFPKTKISRWYDGEEFAQAYANNYLDTVIDYDNLPVDNEMVVPEKVKRNVVVDEQTDSLLEQIVPDTTTYDYITWTNTLNLQIQFEICPVLQYYSGPLEKNFEKEYQGEWLKRDILAVGNSDYLWNTRNTFYKDNYPEFYVWFDNTKNTYPIKWNNYLNWTFGYRLRYVDIDNKVSSPWVYVMPDKKFNTYKMYIEYSDGEASNSSDATGTENTYTNLDNIEDALVDTNRENQFKEEYDVVDNEADAEEVLNWLNTVIDFIKGTPELVKTVLSFLPQPILYGMYVVIFLGVIASGIAVLKALI